MSPSTPRKSPVARKSSTSICTDRGFARYVRVGLEDKQRTDPSGGIEFYIGFREVEVFGRPTNQVGILSFTASTNQVASGQNVTLSWAVDDVRRVEIHPGIGSVGAFTSSHGLGSVTVPVNGSTEFMLVATNAAGTFARAVSVQVGASALPVQLSELVAANKFSLEDGYGDAPDWIELRNPGTLPVNLTGWGLSDDPAQPMKWTFPSHHRSPRTTRWSCSPPAATNRSIQPATSTSASA